MKYGDTLALRSVQEWLPYNVDYTEIKNLIKEYTTKRPPVTTSDQHTEFEDELFEVFMDQLGRIDLFVKSKAGEIDRRIVGCGRQITELGNNRKRRKAHIANRYAKIEQEVIRVGHDIQSLSRFVNVQRTAFHKLLKKYRKWTGSACLPDRVRIILESPTAFHRHNFDQNVIEVSELLTAVRDGINTLSDDVFSAPSRQNLHNDRTHAATNGTARQDHTRSRLDLDLAFATSQITNHGGCAVFWVHNEHIIELQVFLLRHLTLQASSPTTSVAATPLASRRNSEASFAVKGDSVGCVILDDLNTFSNIQNTTTIDEVTKSAMRTAGRIQWCSSDAEAAVVVSDHSGTILEDLRPIEIVEVKTKKKQIEALLDPKSAIPSLREVESMQQRRDMEKIRAWLKSHPGVTPLAKIFSHRNRFSGRVAGGEAWAFVDRDIKMVSYSGERGGLTTDDEGSEAAKVIEFPHAVVSVQWDGKQTPAFIHELTHSHFVESVPGFSIEIHAIAVLYEPKDMLPPVWLPALSKDIRKTPTQRPAHSRRSSSHIFFSNASSKNSSVTTGDSGRQYQSTPGTSDVGVLENSRKKRKRRAAREIKSISNARYWNEFDDDEEHEEPYTVLIRPSSSYSYDDPTEQSLTAYMLSSLTRVFSLIRNGFRRDKGKKRSEQSPLLGGISSGLDTDSEPDYDGASESGIRNYNTFGIMPSRRTVYDAGHMALLTISFLMLMVSGALAVGESLSGHKRGHKHIGKLLVVDLSVLVGVLICLTTGVLGLTIFLVGARRVSWPHRLSVLSTFAAVCVGCGVILTMTSRDIMGEA
ncbi:hypothetical protein FN846DRAFT_65070 [Sphaerosporella brunnea]|uniref:SPX domain-containing protein n=1 Tax=Sphaerosporella brunnea TaxID=1250544 RepID=A0A5J5EU49_9PEZI|nr:hypothetical protein FN846DRAFT_65070 [Sphaerosporella brunnea]